jgi:hypothetical protein
VYRFLRIAATRTGAESPTEEMLRDPPFIANLVVSVIAVVAIIYTAR